MTGRVSWRLTNKPALFHWVTQVDTNKAAVITGSPVVVGNMVIVGVSSSEEGLADTPGYVCCTFRGSLVALNVNTGAILWKTYTVPDNGGQPTGYSVAVRSGSRLQSITAEGSSTSAVQA